jgi:hypothetical protein
MTGPRRANDIEQIDIVDVDTSGEAVETTTVETVDEHGRRIRITLVSSARQPDGVD